MTITIEKPMGLIEAEAVLAYEPPSTATIEAIFQNAAALGWQHVTTGNWDHRDPTYAKAGTFYLKRDGLSTVRISADLRIAVTVPLVCWPGNVSPIEFGMAARRHMKGVTAALLVDRWKDWSIRNVMARLQGEPAIGVNEARDGIVIEYAVLVIADGVGI